MLPITVLKPSDGDTCPVRQVLANVMGKWQSLIVLVLEDGPTRFSAIKRLIGDISQRVLTENLRDLERDGYISRTVKAGPPVEVSYALTALGRELLAHLRPLVDWAARSFEHVVEMRTRYDQRGAS
jgi:DNA-binding HxlR family transcriptional regulator